jgi:hypothetical protein
MLEEVFVPLGLDLSANMPGFKIPSRNLTIQELEQIQNLNIWHFIRKAEGQGFNPAVGVKHSANKFRFTRSVTVRMFRLYSSSGSMPNSRNR